MKGLKVLNRVLLGLLILVAGLLKIFIIKPGGVTNMLAGFGFPAAGFFAWLLILSELIFGVLIIADWNLKYVVVPPILIMIIAGFLVYREDIPVLVLHLVAAVDYAVIAYADE